MSELVHMIFHDPLLFGVAAFGVLLVVGLKLSDWTDKRRERRLQALRDQLKKQQRGTRQSLESNSDAAPASANGPSSRLPFRIFRWEFVLVAIAVGAVAIPMKLRVSARAAAPEAKQTVAASEGPASARTNRVSKHAAEQVRVRATDLRLGKNALAFPVRGDADIGTPSRVNSY